MEYRVKVYRNSRGEEPISDYINGLRASAETNKSNRIRLNKIDYYIQALRQYGTRIGEPYVKYLEDEIWELRPLNDRIFFFYWKDSNFVLLHHFQKKTQKTPRREIEQAIRNKNDLIRRSEYYE